MQEAGTHFQVYARLYMGEMGALFYPHHVLLSLPPSCHCHLARPREMTSVADPISSPDRLSGKVERANRSSNTVVPATSSFGVPACLLEDGSFQAPFPH
jgi:hypothetical protein